MAGPNPNDVRYDLGKQVATDPETGEKRLVWTIVYINGEVETREQLPNGDWQTVDVEIDPKYQAIYKMEQSEARAAANPETAVWTDPTNGSQWLLDKNTGEKTKQLSGPIPGYRPSGVPAAAQGRAPRWAEEEEYDKLQVENAKLDIQKKQQGLENPYNQKMKYITEAYKKISELQQAIGNGQIDEADAKRQMQTFQDWIQADMMGATPFQMQKDTRDFNYKKEVDRRKLASDVLGTRAQAGTSLANGLMNSLFGAYGKMYSGANPNYNIDYFGMVKGLTDEVAGGQDLNELGMAILKGAFSPKGGW